VALRQAVRRLADAKIDSPRAGYFPWGYELAEGSAAKRVARVFHQVQNVVEPELAMAEVLSKWNRLAYALSARRKKPEKKRAKLSAALPMIVAVLEGDRRASRKQRHTARRIYRRIRAELLGCEGGIDGAGICAAAEAAVGINPNS